jgi:hypothetical protein
MKNHVSALQVVVQWVFVKGCIFQGKVRGNVLLRGLGWEDMPRRREVPDVCWTHSKVTSRREVLQTWLEEGNFASRREVLVVWQTPLEEVWVSVWICWAHRRMTVFVLKRMS